VICRTCPSTATVCDRCMTCATAPLRRRKHKKTRAAQRTISVSAVTHARIDAYAEREGRSVRGVVDEVILMALDAEEVPA
jgi:hypothetical protein